MQTSASLQPAPSAAPAYAHSRAASVHPAGGTVVVTVARQLPPEGVGAAVKSKDPPEPQLLTGTAVQAPEGEGVTVAQADPEHVWSPWNVPVAEHCWPDAPHAQPQAAAGAVSPACTSAKVLYSVGHAASVVPVGTSPSATGPCHPLGTGGTHA